MDGNIIYKKMNKLISIYQKHKTMFLGLFIIILIGLLVLKGCSIKKVEDNNKQINKELIEKQKHYQDSIKVLNKKLEKLNVKKGDVVIDYKTKVEYITKYKIRLQTEYIDTGSLIIMYDSTLALCDSLIKINYEFRKIKRTYPR